MSEPDGVTESMERSSSSSSEEYSSADEEAGYLALAIDPTQLSEGTGLPQNGHDYLKSVQMEREQYPAVATAPQPPPTPQMAAKKIKIKLSTPPRQEIEHDDLKYRDEILNNFKELKEKIDSIRESNLVKEAGASSDDGQLSEKQFKKQSSRAFKKASNLMKLMEIGQRPQVSTLILHTQYELYTTLEKMADEYEMTPHHSTIIHTDWLYSIMAALREPIEPDIYSTLRRLARLCIAKRELYEAKKKKKVIQKEHNHGPTAAASATEKASEVIVGKSRGGGGGCSSGSSVMENNEELVRQLEEEEYTSSLLIICIVRYYYGQVDLK